MQMRVKISYECSDLFFACWYGGFFKGVASEATGICILAPANFTEVYKIGLQVDVDFR